MSKPKLVPRFVAQGFTPENLQARRSWVEEVTGRAFPTIGACSIPSEQMRGNVENPIGSVQMPLGVAGPLEVDGEHAKGTFYVPLATTEGALVRSYERGMVTLSRIGGVQARVLADHNVMAPSFRFADVVAATDFARSLPQHLGSLREVVAGTTNHGRLEAIECRVSGREVIVSLIFATGDAHGMNMVSKAIGAACQWIVANTAADDHVVFSAMTCEKRAGGYLWGGAKGKKVVAGATVPARALRTYLHTSAEQIIALMQSTRIGHLQGGVQGYNGHLANGLAALFIATGQDVANIANSAVGITDFAPTAEGGIYASVTLPSLTVATVGGGVGLGTSRECLEMIDCFGSGKALKFAEITAATLLAGELSFAAAIASGEFVAAHETYGRNRPEA